MKKISPKNLLLLILLTLATACPALASEQYIPGEALVVIKDPAAARSARSAGGRAATLATSVRAQAETTYTALSEADGKIYALIRSDTQSTEELIESLKQDPNVLAASPNWIIRAQAKPNDPRYTELWGMTAIGAEAAWDITSGDATVYVAVLDTGIQSNHEDLKENIAGDLARDFTKDDPDSNVSDGDGHGTHVSGTIGAVGNNGKGVTGVNWRVRIIPVKVLDDTGTGSTSTLVAGINYIVGLLRDDPSMKIAAVNLSAAGYSAAKPADVRNDADWLAFRALDKQNRAVLVFAAGNEGVEADAPLTQDVTANGSVIGHKGQYNYPTSYPGLDNVIVVGAISKGGTAWAGTNWSGRSVHLVAPGADILSTYNGNASVYRTNSGTSMAAPHVSGAAALLAAKNPAWTASQIKHRLLTTAVQPTNSGSPASIKAQFVPDKTVSAYGLLRIDRALSDDVSPAPVPAEKFHIYVPPLRVGESGAAVVTVLPYHATSKDFNIEWSSSNPAVLTIDSNGIVQARSEGTATVKATATTEDGKISISSNPDESGQTTVTEAPSSGGGGGGGGGCSALAGALPLAAAAVFLAARKRARAK